MKEAILLQLIFAAVMLVTSVLVGIAPLYIKSFGRNRDYASIGNCFSGGVFLSVAVVHLLPDGNTSLADSIGSDIPLGYFLAVVGYLAILLVEKIIFSDYGQHEATEASSLLDRRGLINSEENEESKPLFDNQEMSKNRAILTGFILAVALSIHSIFEGIAIGLQKTVDTTLSLSLAVIIHKLPAAMALGINLLDNVRSHALLLVCIFSSSSPIGILVGIGLQSMHQPILEGVFMSLCSGTFLYIATSEIIAEEFNKPVFKKCKYAALWVGFFITGGLMLLLES